MFIPLNYLQANNVYQVCITVSNTATKEGGQACTKYKSYGDSNLFSFSVTPNTGKAYDTNFIFTTANTQTLTQQYFYEFGYIQYILDNNNQPTDALYVPFETS